MLTALERTSALILLALVGFFVYQGIWTSETGTFSDFGDHRANSVVAERALRDGVYPGQIYYPPPNLVLRGLLARLGEPAAGLLWMAGMVLSLACSIYTLLRLTGLDRSGRRITLSLFSVLAILWYLQWDFRTMNSNTVFLALVLAAVHDFERGRETRAGLWLATSIVFKIYSAALIPYWLWRRDYRSVFACLAALLAYFVLLPAWQLGPGGAFELTRSWLEAVSNTGRPDFVVDFVAYKVSLRWLLANLFGAVDPAQGAVLADWPLHWTNRLARIVELGWLVVVVAWIARRRPRGPASLPASRGLLEAGVILMAALFASPLLQPHHGVVLLIPAFLLVSAAADRETPAPHRIAFTGALVVCGLGPLLAPSGLGRAAVMLATLVAFSLALLPARENARARHPEPPAPQSLRSQLMVGILRPIRSMKPARKP